MVEVVTGHEVAEVDPQKEELLGLHGEEYRYVNYYHHYRVIIKNRALGKVVHESAVTLGWATTLMRCQLRSVFKASVMCCR